MSLKDSAIVLATADTDGTDYPYWVIVDPTKNMSCDIDIAAGQCTGPFFSRKDAENTLKNNWRRFSDKARVYCQSGYLSPRYREVYDLLKQLVR